MEAFKIKNGLSAKRYLGSNGTETAGSTSYYISGAEYASKSFSVSGQDSNPRDLAFNANGTKMFIVGITNDNLHQYSLSTGFDVSTASYDSVSFSISSQDGTAISLEFNTNGTKMYIAGSDNDSIYQYTLSTAFDLSTASYDSVSFNVGNEETAPYGLTFNTDGTKMFVVGQGSDNVYQYTLSTGFDLNTASYDSVSFSIAGQDGGVTGLAFNTDGTKMFIIGNGTDAVYQYTLSTAFDLSTASYDSVSFSVATQATSPTNFVFNNDGSKMYVLNFGDKSVHQYSAVAYTQTLDLSTGTTFSFTPSGATTVSFTNPPASGNAIGFSVEINGDGSAITWPSSVKWDLATAPTATATKELYTFVTTDGGTTYYGKKAAEGVA